MKELKDYLHLYLGCEIDISGQREILDSVAKSGQIETLFRGHLRNYRDLSDEDIAPILRPLSDMTDEEYTEYANIEFGEDTTDWDYDEKTKRSIGEVTEFNRFAYLLKKHFDLFGLIEAGLAIDKTTLK